MKNIIYKDAPSRGVSTISNLQTEISMVLLK